MPMMQEEEEKRRQEVTHCFPLWLVSSLQMLLVSMPCSRKRRIWRRPAQRPPCLGGTWCVQVLQELCPCWLIIRTIQTAAMNAIQSHVTRNVLHGSGPSGIGPSPQRPFKFNPMFFLCLAAGCSSICTSALLPSNRPIGRKTRWWSGSEYLGRRRSRDFSVPVSAGSKEAQLCGSRGDSQKVD